MTACSVIRFENYSDGCPLQAYPNCQTCSCNRNIGNSLSSLAGASPRPRRSASQKTLVCLTKPSGHTNDTPIYMLATAGMTNFKDLSDQWIQRYINFSAKQSYGVWGWPQEQVSISSSWWSNGCTAVPNKSYRLA
jgi:hypothetical protein